MRRSLTALLLGFAVLSGCGDESHGETVAVRVVGPDEIERLAVEATIADDENERREGLAGIGTLPSDRGLLIVLPAEGEVCITNGGVGFPIDAVFAADDGTVIAVERNVPMGDVTLRCQPSTRRILELNAGVAAEVVPGDQLVL